MQSPTGKKWSMIGTSSPQKNSSPTMPHSQNTQHSEAFSMRSASETPLALAPEWTGYKLNLEMTTLHSSKHLDTLNGSRDMMNLQPTLITSPSLKRSLSVNKQKEHKLGNATPHKIPQCRENKVCSHPRPQIVLKPITT